MTNSNLSRDERLELEDEGYVVSHPDHEDVQRIAVEDWEHIVARVTGTGDHLRDCDGVDIEMDQFAGDGGVVEIVVKGEVVTRLVHVPDDASDS